jgi:hypothetical protein
MKQSFLLLLLFFCLVLPVGGQNLVPNPSFEEMISCPEGIGDFSVASWYSPSLASPDYFHPCGENNSGAPQNGFGNQLARTGDGYVGVHLSDLAKTSTDYREYIQCELLEPLESGELYAISFFVSRTDSSVKACDNLGAYLSSGPLLSSDNLYLPVVPQVVSPPNEPIISSTEWIEIHDTIVADGGEQFLSIGVFTNNENTNWVGVEGGWELEPHYYIDDVSVYHVLIDEVPGSKISGLNIYPNPSDNIVHLKSEQIITGYIVYNSLGLEILREEVNSKHNELDFSNYPRGVYFIQLRIGEMLFQRKLQIN